MFQFTGSNLDILLSLAFSLLLLVLFVLTNGIRRLLVAGLFAVFMSILSPALALIRSVTVLGSLPVMDSISKFLLPGNGPYARLPTWMYYQSMPVYLLQVTLLSMGVILAASLLSSGIRLYQERARARAVGFYDLPAFRNRDDRLAGANLLLSGLLVGVTLFHLYWLFLWDRIRNGEGFFLYFFPVLVAVLSGVLLLKSLKSGVPPIDVLKETLSAGKYKINKPGNSFRLLSLALLVVAIFGPWGYDRIHLPAGWDCSPPYVRLEGDFCGTPILGITMVFWFAAGFPLLLWQLLIDGIEWANLAPDLIFLSLGLLVILPVLTSFFLLLRSESRGLRLFHALVLLLASGLGILAFTSTGSGNQILWGGQLYFGLVVLLLVLEGLAFAQGRRLGPGV